MLRVSWDTPATNPISPSADTILPAMERSAPSLSERALAWPPSPRDRKGSPSSPPAVSMSILEPMPPSIRSGVEDLVRRAPASRSTDRARKRNWRPLWVELRMFSLKATGAPFSVTDWNSGPRPRTLTNCPSPTSRSMATPGTRCRASARLAAGRSPIRSDATTSDMTSAARLRLSPTSIWSERRPTTSTAFTSTGGACWGGGGDGADVATQTRTPREPTKR